MSPTTECCAQCGIDLFETTEGSGARKIFRSFGIKMINGVEVHYCYSCYKKLNDKFMGEESDDK